MVVEQNNLRRMGLMRLLKKEVTEYLVSILRRNRPIHEFEIWLYDNEKLLEESLGEAVYFELINLNYKSKFILDDLEPILIRIIDYRSYEEFKIRDLLTSLVYVDKDFLSSCRQIYSEYCNGYTFLRIIALKFIDFDYDLQLNDLRKYKEYIDQYRHEIIEEGKRLLAFFESSGLEIVGDYEYIDLRSIEDKIEERYWT
ncbi:hypothetical protein [Paenibacillus sp. PDC88]|uniref:hypothetical protein n=1 Tax=Paenibacillus sp. PDC88 TaxID=1884375 RepID=UPI001160009F|nr:hypothetical protein [Paenibacillus sp. PDC88]